jgi:hypothetical protein
MLKTFFIAALVILPLALAVVLIAYRARYFVLGIGVVVFVVAVIWGGIRIAAMFEPDQSTQSAGPAATPISCVVRADGIATLPCRL